MFDRFARWIDDEYDAGEEQHALLRVAKLAEEVGEVAEAVQGLYGANPRKGITHTVDDVKGELLDVAVTALAAWEHFDDYSGLSGVALTAHASARWARIEDDQ